MAIRRGDMKRVALFCFCTRGDVQGAVTMAAEVSFRLLIHELLSMTTMCRS
jgi:hypothetical protein